MGSASIFFLNGIEYVTAANISDKEYELSPVSYRLNINVRITFDSILCTFKIKKFGALIACFTVQYWCTFFSLGGGSMTCETCSQ